MSGALERLGSLLDGPVVGADHERGQRRHRGGGDCAGTVLGPRPRQPDIVGLQAHGAEHRMREPPQTLQTINTRTTAGPRAGLTGHWARWPDLTEPRAVRRASRPESRDRARSSTPTWRWPWRGCSC